LKFIDKSNEEPVLDDDENSIPNINQENSTKMLAGKSSKVDEDSQPDLLAAKTFITQDDELSDAILKMTMIILYGGRLGFAGKFADNR
jgi:hypothetical protein